METKNQAPEQEPKQKPAAKKPVDPETYSKFINLKFLQLSGAKLKDEQTKSLQELEKELKGCAGRIATKTVRAAISNEQALMVAGIPVPENIEKLVVSAGSEGYYFKS